MRNRYTKALALLLAILAAFALTLSGLSVALNLTYEFYWKEPEEVLPEYMGNTLSGVCYEIGHDIAAEYLMEQAGEPGTAEHDLFGAYFGGTYYRDYEMPDSAFVLRDSRGNVLRTGGRARSDLEVLTKTVEISRETGKVVCLGANRKAFPSYGSAAAGYVWEDVSGNRLEAPAAQTRYYDLNYMGQNIYRIDHYPSETFRVELHLTQEDVDALTLSRMGLELLALQTSAALRWTDMAVAAVSLAVLLTCLIYLWTVSGKHPDTDEIRPEFVSALPLDLLAALCAGMAVGIYILLNLSLDILNSTFPDPEFWFRLAVCGLGASASLAALTLASFGMALFAQLRLGGWRWLTGTVCLRLTRWVLGLVWKLAKWAWRWLEKPARAVWHGIKLPALWAGGLLKRMGVIWRWLVLLAAWLALVLLTGNIRTPAAGFIYLILAFLGIAAALWCAWSFDRLCIAAEKMSAGDLQAQVGTELLSPSMQPLAQELNALSQVCVDAAREQVKAERMRTELITNVTHDIKTPLTSIINYVDLLRCAETPEQRQEYLQVLDRQSQSLKKLIEDLLELSKTATGNITVEATRGDLAEAVNQALGEFSDRLEARQLQVIFRREQEQLEAVFDGKLMWRVLSNLLGNIVKYAQPGTRVYLDLQRQEGRPVLTLRNISAQELNLRAEELMERFVRGDASRSGQGNGLGLNIAAGLMQAQKGSLKLTVDGDLFKVTLTLPEEG